MRLHSKHVSGRETPGYHDGVGSAGRTSQRKQAPKPRVPTRAADRAAKVGAESVFTEPAVAGIAVRWVYAFTVPLLVGELDVENAVVDEAPPTTRDLREAAQAAIVTLPVAVTRRPVRVRAAVGVARALLPALRAHAVAVPVILFIAIRGGAAEEEYRAHHRRPQHLAGTTHMCAS